MTKALIVVDMQNAYFNNEALDERKEKLVEVCSVLVSKAARSGSPIYFLRTLHRRDKSTWTLNMLDDNEGYLFENDSDAKYVKGLDKTSGIEIIKTRDSGFQETDLLERLHNDGADEVVLCGVSTHTCVMATAIDAYAANLRLIIAEDGVASHDPSFHDMTLRLLEQEYRARIVAHSEIDWSNS